MELEKTIDSSEVVARLLEDNKKLRLELAVLSAYEKQETKNSKKSIIENLSEEDLNKISPEALEALQTLRVE